MEIEICGYSMNIDPLRNELKKIQAEEEKLLIEANQLSILINEHQDAI